MYIPKLNYKETKKGGKYEKSERGVWDTMLRSSFFFCQSSQRWGEKEWGLRIFEETMVKNFLIWWKILKTKEREKRDTSSSKETVKLYGWPVNKTSGR